MLKTHEICRDFKSGGDIIHALKNVNINIAESTLTMFRGRSGSGKTTLINLLGALDKPTAGTVEFDGREITKLSERKRDTLRRREIGFCFQSVALISMMTAYENVEFGLRIAGYNFKERGQRVKECLELVGLGKRMDHMPAELSGGEQQRVAIARAVAHKPKIVIADEPTAELDTLMGVQVIKLFKTLVDKEKLTIIMTTHDPSLLDLADKVYTLEDGVITDEQ